MSYNRSMKVLIVLLLSFFAAFTLSENIEAKMLPQAAKSATKTVAKSSAGTGINITPRLRADRRALIVYFSNLQNAKVVSYLLTYKTNGQEEGARGDLSLGKSATSQELLFGTCSKQVCRYHSNIKDARLEVSYTSKSGKKYLKKYKIRV